MPNKELTAKEMMTRDAAGEDLLRQSAERLLAERPYIRDFFAAFGLPTMERRQTAGDVFDGLDAERLEDLGVTREQLAERFSAFIEKMESFRREGIASVREVSIIGGRDKDGRPEDVRLDLRTGEVIAVVGPTGAGKSLLLSDIECLAQGDTPKAVSSKTSTRWSSGFSRPPSASPGSPSGWKPRSRRFRAVSRGRS